MIRAKKSLGQHFLIDENIAYKIVDSLENKSGNVLEIGPGTGVLTKYLLDEENFKCKFIETDGVAFDFLLNKYPEHKSDFLLADFLKKDLNEIFDGPFSIIGNLPYNISSQIFFKVLDYRNQVSEVVCMIQKEVGARIASGKGNKQYGILSVFLQAFYEIEYLFTVSENVFDPPPKVKSAVIRLKRNKRQALDCDEKLFFRIVKSGFNYRRKTLRNALKGMVEKVDLLPQEIIKKRAEQMSIEDFEDLTRRVEGL
jgi:16S rRNA (adenine1518-N6/adenine1519-N6)-dimethyltransferase